MVPARLKLRNFLCYRGDCPPLDLEHIRVACLTGDNGNGKSALLDAMTWALWGRARGKSDGELVTLGQTEMEVELEFFVGEARYRVIRKHRRVGARGSGHTALFFQMWDGQNWRDASGSTQSETQRRLLDVLKLSYETFVNSAFLLQGRADAFTIKTPGERKQVLAEILNLAQYDAFAECAKERRNERSRTIEILERQIHDDEYALQKLPERRAELEKLRAELADRETERKEAKTHHDTLRRGVDELLSLRRELEEVEARRQEAADHLAHAEAQVRDRHAEIASYEAIIARGEAIRAGFAALGMARARLRDLEVQRESLTRQLAGHLQNQADITTELTSLEERITQHHTVIGRYTEIVEQGEAIRAGYARLTQAREMMAAQDQRFQAWVEFDRRIASLTETVRQAEAEQRTELALKQREADGLASSAAALAELSEQRLAVEREQVELGKEAERLEALRAEEAAARAEAQVLTSRNAVLRAEIEGLKHKFDELKAAVERGDADCPLCHSNLGHDGLRRIEENYRAEGKAKQEEFRANRTRIEACEAIARSRGEQARGLESDLARRRGDWQSRYDRLDREIAAARAAAESLPAVRAAIERLIAALASGEVARAERDQIAALERERNALGYDAEAHEQARRDLAAYAEYEAQHQDLIRAEFELAAARTLLKADEAAAAGWRRRAAEAAEAVRATRAEIDALPLADARQEVDSLAPAENEHQDLLAAEKGLPLARGALEREEASVQRERARLRTDDKRAAALRVRIAELAGVEEQLEPAAARVRELEARCDELRQALGACEHDIKELEERERACRLRRARLDEVRQEHGVYDELVRAFGRQGVQALIIDSVLPEIEATANDLLARMTNNRMHLSLETQRQTQKGTLVETLDINIADEWGTRSYEMFSGGEAFRINLALRIALSKLLARRAGAPLPTLVIDEGFGTQDAVGRERLVEAITAIQDDFQCLLIVTHLDDLKDLFDTRIEVVKSGDGSVARVVTV